MHENTELGPNTFLYPIPTVVVGATVQGKQNYLTAAYCGIAGHKPPAISVTLKSSHFQGFYGTLEKAPMIAECALNLECRLVHALSRGDHELFVGEIVQVYAAESVLTNGLTDIHKLDPTVFSMHDNSYWKVGERIGDAWRIGKFYQPEG